MLYNILAITMLLFVVIDMVGSIPIILSLRKRGIPLNPFRITIFSSVILVLFLFLGERLLNILGVDINSFSMAGSIVLFFLALEMIMGRKFFKVVQGDQSDFFPMAFPLIAGSGSMIALLTLRVKYSIHEILIGLLINMFIVYFVLKFTPFIQRFLKRGGLMILEKFFGIVVLAIAVKMFLINLTQFVKSF